MQGQGVESCLAAHTLVIWTYTERMLSIIHCLFCHLLACQTGSKGVLYGAQQPRAAASGGSHKNCRKVYGLFTAFLSSLIKSFCTVVAMHIHWS